jgi:cyanophycinase-like exopeptidase
MTGPVALVGAGEFLSPMAEFDLGLLRATGRHRPRVVIIPAAAYPLGEDAYESLIERGRSHFRDLGAEVEPVDVHDRRSAEDPANAQAVGEADLIYLASGRQRHLLDVLAGSAVWAAATAAHERGAILAGCCAGAVVLAGQQFDLRSRRGWPMRWRPALGAVDGVAVLPRYDARPEPLMALMALRAPQGSVVLGIDDGTAVVGRDGAWQVHGSARVTVWRGHRRVRLRSGDVFRIHEAPDR